MKKGAAQPLRTREEIEKVKNWLLKNSSYRDYMFFYIGINTGLRVNDLLKLKVSDVRNTDTISVGVGNNKRKVEVSLGENVKTKINEYCEDMDVDDWLFPSRIKGKPVSDKRIFQVFKDVEKAFSLQDFTSDTMRKTFGYHYFQKEKNVFPLMAIFGHSKKETTLKYIGVEIEETKEMLEDFEL